MTPPPPKTDCRVAPALPFHGPAGEPLPIADVAIRIAGPVAKPREVALTFTLAPAEWARVDEAGWFHLAPDVRGPTFGGAFDADRPVEIEARVREDLLSRFEGAADIFDVAARVVAEPEDGALRAAESWVALYVKQAHPLTPNLKTGFRTRWAEAD